MCLIRLLLISLLIFSSLSSKCESWTGEMINSTSPEVCHRNGNCTINSTCNCFDDSYGFNCIENVEKNGHFKIIQNMLNEVEIPYSIPKKFLRKMSDIIADEYSLPQYDVSLNSDFFCYFILFNETISKIGNKSYCWFDWETDEDVTYALFIEPEKQKFEQFEKIETFYLKSLSRNNNTREKIEVTITHPPFVIPPEYIIVFSIIVGVFIALILCLLCVLCIYCCRNFIQKRKLKRFESIKNVKQLLEEQNLNDESSKSDMAQIKINKGLFEIDLEEISFKNILGSGGGGAIVYRVEWKSNDFAFKCFKTQDLCQDQQTFDLFEREVSILASISHPHVLNFYGATLKPPRVGILIEYCEHGDLRHYLMGFKQEHGVELGLKRKLELLCEICEGMDFLHSKNIIHRDLKCENVLVNGNLEAKVMDFGCSKIVKKDSDTTLTKRIGTSKYMAPEVVISDTGNYTEKCDVFSFSIIMVEVITGNFHPYGRNNLNIEYKVAKDPSFRPPIKDLEIPQFLKTLMFNNWNHDPEKRMTFNGIRENIKENMKTNFWGKMKYEDKRNSKKSLLIHVQLDDETDLRDINIPVSNLSYKGLKKIIKSTFKKGVNLKKKKIFIKLDDDNFTKLENDNQVKGLKYDSLLLIKDKKFLSKERIKELNKTVQKLEKKIETYEKKLIENGLM